MRNKDKHNARFKRWYHANKHRTDLKTFSEEAKKRNVEQTRTWRRGNPAYTLFSNAKRRAGEAGLEFTLDWKDIVIPSLCPILLIPLIVGTGIQNDNSPALDRIDNTKGYTKENSRVISHKANRQKADFSLEQIERLLVYMKG